MPQIHITAQLIRITRAIQVGEWLLIHPDERYEVLSHEQAMTLQGRRIHEVRKTPNRKTKPTLAKPTHAVSMQLNGRTIHVEPQKIAVLQYMATHGQLTVEEVQTLLDTPKTSILSALKTLGLVTSKPDHTNRHAPHIYSITNEGRAIANGAVPNVA